MQDNIATVKKIKVCYVVTKGVWGGAQKYVYNLATSLPKDKYDVLVITGHGDVLPQKLDEKNIRFIKIESMKRDISIVAEIKSFFKLFWIICTEKPDVIHLNSPKAGGLGALIGRILFVKKIIYTAHGWTFNEDRPILQNALILFFSWVTILLSNRVIVIAGREEEQAKNIPLVNPRKIVLIRNGIEKIEFKDKESSRKELLKMANIKDDSETIWIGTISEIHKNKGLSFAIEALRKIKDPFNFFILNNGVNSNALKSLIAESGLSEKVFLVTAPLNANLYLRAFDIFTLTSIKEGLPFVLLEAGLAEIAVIASNIGGIPEIVDNGKNGILVTKARSGEITRAVEYLINSPEERKTFGKKLRIKVEKDFSFEQMLQKTEKLYTE